MNFKKLDTYGKVFSSENSTVVHKQFKKGDNLPKHNHPNHEIFFNLAKGKAKVYINDSETIDMEEAQVIAFEGENYISADILEDCDIFIYLVPKRECGKKSVTFQNNF